ncbi:D-2-hydroxyacid dehydrogenase [Ligilactobacillus sp. WILCCON 0076]|uniref:D-2-hydroxyacid dehydrogenase n=1 Tax=Ligilactobacillus ubinensis TaxID=2876789 RepID=A0A9X2FI75_9LACO|nr:D-2-hydroxyacid dehydrogenase [Ligilactobacillus ubinensis]MCP0886412.1 D-2-hydroxyacid dehydrogenase [Ligilactobacillus ubinensis]
MKFIAFNVREDERVYFEEWSKVNNIKVDLHTEEITSDNLNSFNGYDAVIGLQTGKYPAGFFEKMKEFGIRDFSIRNVGVDNVDLQSAKDNEVTVTNVPAYSPNAIAEFAITQLMQMLRQTRVFRRKFAKQDYRWAPYISKELRALTVGVIGTGRIGRAAIDILKGFGAKIVAYDPYHNPQLEEEGVYVDTLDELYQVSDAITLHMPATEQDRHIIDAKAIAKMKDGVYIVNTARGILIDTTALIAALKSGKIAGAALDTYENETPIFNRNLQGRELQDKTFKELISLDNALVTPHIAFYTETAVENMVIISLDSAKSVVETGTAATVVKY